MARQPLTAQNLDVQHRRNAHRGELRNDVCHSARTQEGEVGAADDPTTSREVSRLSHVILWGSALIWSGGFFVAYLLGPILERMDR